MLKVHLRPFWSGLNSNLLAPIQVRWPEWNLSCFETLGLVSDLPGCLSFFAFHFWRQASSSFWICYQPLPPPGRASRCLSPWLCRPSRNESVVTRYPSPSWQSVYCSANHLVRSFPLKNSMKSPINHPCTLKLHQDCLVILAGVADRTTRCQNLYRQLESRLRFQMQWLIQYCWICFWWIRGSLRKTLIASFYGISSSLTAAMTGFCWEFGLAYCRSAENFHLFCGVSQLSSGAASAGLFLLWWSRWTHPRYPSSCSFRQGGVFFRASCPAALIWDRWASPEWSTSLSSDASALFCSFCYFYFPKLIQQTEYLQ